MVRHPTLTPDQYRTELQTHLDEVMFVLVIAEPTMKRIGEVFALRERIEQMLDAAVYPPSSLPPE